MRRALIGQGNRAASVKFAPRLAFHQHRQSARDKRQRGFLPGDHIRQVFDGARQMGDLFFKMRDVCHVLHLHRNAARAKHCIAPVICPR